MPWHARVAELEVENAGLRAQLADARGVTAALEQRLAAAEARIAELAAQVGQNSSNSSRPPSSDGLSKRPAVPRRSGGKRGKQPGTPGAHLAQTETPDEVIVHVPACCEGCGGPLDDAEVAGQVVRQVFDLPPLRLTVTEHRAQRRRCGCAAITTAGFPGHVTAPACYGPRVRALIAYLAGYQHLPVDRLARMLSDVLAAPVSTGTVAAVLAEAAGAVTPAVDAIRAQLAAAPVAHFDETGARIAGSLHWVHSASTDTLAYYHPDAKRGVVGMDNAGVLPGFSGIAVHDGYPHCRCYDVGAHGLCNAHHLRELAGIAEQGAEQDWAGLVIETLLAAKRMVDEAKAAGQAALDPELIAGIRARYAGHIAQGHAANPPPPKPPDGRRPKQSKATNLVARLDEHRADVLRFMTDFAVPFDNNMAERDVRMVKLQQKISGCFRTLEGAKAFCALRSYVATARKQHHNILDVLTRAFTGNPWIPPAAATAPAAAA